MKTASISLTLGSVPVRSANVFVSMVGSTAFLLAVVTFVPWAVPLFMPRVI